MAEPTRPVPLWPESLFPISLFSLLPGAMAQRGDNFVSGSGWPSRFDPNFIPPSNQKGGSRWPRARNLSSPYPPSTVQALGARPKAPATTWISRRWDEPRLQARQGPARLDAGLASVEVQQAALTELRRDVFSSSHAPVVESKLKTVQKALALWQLDLLPPSVVVIEALAASLKWGGYRSASSYLSVYKGYVERSGFSFGAPESRAMADAIRSCERGMGGPVKAMALPFDRLHELPGLRAPWAAGGPASPRNMMVAGAWFLTREIELSTARAQAVTIDTSCRPPRVHWHLPVSKADPKALGTSRVHGCSCPASGPSASCPTHALWDQLLFLAKLHPASFETLDGGAPKCVDPNLPLFPTSSGEMASKTAVTDTIVAAARFLHLPAMAADGSERISGHSLRATGAQGLSRLGLDLWAIQLLGRWGSDAVKGYVREAHIHRAAEWAASASRRRELEVLVAEVVAQHMDRGSVDPPRAADVQYLLDRSAAPASASTSSSCVPGAPAASAGGCPSPVPLPALLDAVAEEASLKLSDQVKEGNEDKSEEEFVRNEATNVLHRIALGPPLYLISDWTSPCGWKFGRSSMSRIIKGKVIPTNPEWICGRCLRPERQAALVAARNTLQH